MNKNNVKINTVGDLKKALEEYNDDTIINSGSKQLDINNVVRLLDSNVYERVAIREIENEIENIESNIYDENCQTVKFLTSKDIQIIAQELEESCEFSNAISKVSETASLILYKYLNSKMQKPIKEILPEEVVKKSKYGVHKEHCCVKHGCKYGDKDCPVVSGEIIQSYLCESCDFDGIVSVEQLMKGEEIKYENTLMVM